MRLAFAVLPLLLVGCDAFNPLGLGFFNDPYLSVYDFRASDEDGIVTSGEIGLTHIPSDVGGIPDAWSGRWSLDARGSGGRMQGAVSGRGAIRGESSYNDDFTLRAVELTFYDDLPREGSPQEPIGFFLSGQFDIEGDMFVGRWETRGGFTGGVLSTGTFEAHLTRRATEFIIAG